MECYDFNFMPLDMRLDAVWEHGVFLSTRSDGCHSFILYDMGQFFAEVRLKPLSSETDVVLGFSSTASLGPYLDLVDLPTLLRP